MSIQENSTGYVNHPAQILQEIRFNLERYTSGFPVLKELIQNADDAENASEFHFGWSSGLESSVHPLVQAPAIFFLNNGDFRPEHEDAITRFNIGNKPLDKASVGKFGLGMKSVFHWCEAFFYMYGPESTITEGGVTGKILNPWKETEFHDNWNFCPQEIFENIRKTLSPIIGDQQFFCLWIPLRREQDLEGIEPLGDKFPRIDRDVPPSAQAPWGNCMLELAALLPMLHRIRKFVQWAPADDKEKWRQIYSIQLADRATQRRSMRNLVPDNIFHKLFGQVIIQSPDGKDNERGHYAGIEVAIENSELERLQADKAWPTTSAIDSKGKGVQTKVKGEPHAAVSFISLPASSREKSALQFQWAVFLPVQDADSVSLQKRIDFDLRVVLHGYFFLDSGRRWIEGFSKGEPIAPENSQELRSRWNATLAKEAVFPLLIPAFQHWIEQSEVSDEIIEVVTRALQDSEPVKSNLNAITRDLQWVYRLKRDGGGDWDSVPASSPYFSIPAPRTSATNPLDIFPELANLFGENTITYSQKPCITSREPLSLEVEVIDKILENVSVETVLAKPENLEYFVSFMRQNLNERATIESTQLKRVIRKLIRLMPVDANRKSKDGILDRMDRLLRPLFSGLSIPWLIPIPEDGIPLCREIAQYIASQEFCPVLVPDSFAKNERDDFVDPSDVLKVVRAMGAPPPSLSERKQFPSSCHKLVLYLLRNSNQSLILQDTSIQHIPLIQATDCTTDSSSLVTLATISERCNIGTAFTGQREMAKLLQRATPKLPILLVDEETYQLVSDAKTGRPCHNKNIGELFQRNKPTLGSQENRAALLSGLLKNESSALTPEAKHAYRYLLHASGENYESDETLIVSSSGAPGDIWAKVYRTVLNSMSLEWCYVEPELAATLNKHQRDELSIATIDRATTISLLKKHQNELYQIDFRAYAESEREQILEDFPSAALEILSSLPVHASLNGSLTSIDEKTFLLEDVPTCSFVRSSLNLIRPHTNRSIAMRQQAFITPLTRARVLQLILRAETPVQHWMLIADVLRTSTGDEIRPELENLKRREWIPTRNASPAAPKNILWIPDLASAPFHRGRVRDLGYSLKDEVLVEFWSHPGIERFRKNLLPSDEEQLQMLGRVLAEERNYGVGVTLEDEDTLREFVETFRVQGLLPIAGILAQLLEENKHQAYPGRILKFLLPALPESIESDRYVEVLSFLSEEESKAERSEKERWSRWHNRLLTGVVESGFLSDVLPRIRLKNAVGKWRSTNKLCIGEHGVRSEDILCAEHAERLKLKDSHEGESSPCGPVAVGIAGDTKDALVPIATDSRVESGIGILERYFELWLGRIPRELIGAFLSFLGDHSGIQDLAARFLRPRKLDLTRNLLELVPDARAVDFARALDRQRFEVSEHSDETVSVRSITGQIFQAGRSTKIETIFIGDTFKRHLRDGQTGIVTREIQLRKFDLLSVNDVELQEILKRSLEALIWGAYRRRVQNLDKFWEDISNSGQLEVGISRQLILDSLFTIVRQMGVIKSNDKIRDVLHDHDDACREIAQVRSTGTIGTTKYLERKLQEIRARFADLIENDSTVQGLLLVALRKKIGEYYQYRVSSIPFELFQNADDALVELLDMRGETSESHGGEFVVSVRGTSMRVLHWGRPVNEFGESMSKFKGRGYDNDLMKMLVLNISDKGHSDGSSRVTGKYGLGFKSVFLVTDRPRLMSGTLCAEIVGGTWPQNLSHDVYKELEAELRRFRPEDRNGTLIELPNISVSPSEVLAEFRRLAPVLASFSRAITRIRIEEGDANETSHVAWQPERLDEHGMLLLGQLELTPGSTQTTVLKVNLEVNAGPCAFLFRVEAEGFGKLPEEIPTVWVTAPTYETSTLGFAINGPFQLDVGRANLSSDKSSYQSLARGIGREFLSGMEALYQLTSTDWEKCVQKLKLRSDLEPYAFWFSAWELLVKPFADKPAQSDNNAFKLMLEVLWGESSDNLRNFYQDKPVVPTDLWDSHCVLTRAADIDTVLSGILERREVFLCASRWGSATDLLRPGSVIASAVDKVLQALGILRRRSAEVSLIDLLEMDTDRGGIVTVERASLYGELINPTRLAQLEKGTALEQSERESLLKLLADYRFLASDGSVQSSKDLVILSNTEGTDGSETESDEQLRAAFAPASRVLFSGYSGLAADFFRICRKTMGAPLENLVEWALDAQDESRRTAVLEYLLKGRLARELGKSLCDRKANTWLDGFSELPFYKDLDNYKKGLLDALLGVARGQADEADLAYTPIPISSPDPKKALQRIYDWWAVHKEEKIHEYVTETYPSNLKLCLELEFDYRQSEQRRSWISLFLLGMTYKMGRTQPIQHQGFLNLLIEKRWLDVFSDDRIVPDDWIRVLDEFVDNPWEPERYSEWMKLFPSIYRVSRYLSEYAGAFCAVQDFESAFALHEVTSPRDSARFQGGGFDAPPLTRALGFGGCFVLRELVRNGVITQPHAFPHCFVPTKRVTDFFSRLSCGIPENAGYPGSKIIYEFVVQHLGEEQATFGNCFDIPFLLYQDE